MARHIQTHVWAKVEETGVGGLAVARWRVALLAETLLVGLRQSRALEQLHHVATGRGEQSHQDSVSQVEEVVVEAVSWCSVAWYPAVRLGLLRVLGIGPDAFDGSIQELHSEQLGQYQVMTPLCLMNLC